MTTSWLLYSLLVGGLLTLAAWQASRSFAGSWPGFRWIWAVAAGATFLLPLLSLIPSGASSDPVAEPVWSSMLAPAAESMPLPPEPLSPLLWVGASMLALGWVCLSQARLSRERLRWARVVVQGQPVALSDTFGPAVVGVLRPEIVLPRWALRLPEDQLALVLTHEREHLRKQDSRLLALIVTLLVLMPWQLFLWLQLKGMRLAIELDCDGRVVRNGARPERYGELLLNLTAKFGGRRLDLWSLPLTPFSMRHSSLERRIRALAGARPTRLAAIAGLALATIALATAFGLTPPPAPGSSPMTQLPASETGRDTLRKEVSRTFRVRGEPSLYREATSLGFILGVQPLSGFHRRRPGGLGPNGEGC